MAESLPLEWMGARPGSDGVAFRVWAPHASQVSVIGTFNNWDASAHPMDSEPRGYWYAFVDSARIGDHYSFQLSTKWGPSKRIDPYVREVTPSVGDAIIHDPRFP